MKYTIRLGLICFIAGWFLSANYYGLHRQYAQITMKKAEIQLALAAMQANAHDYFPPEAQ